MAFKDFQDLRAADAQAWVTHGLADVRALHFLRALVACGGNVWVIGPENMAEPFAAMLAREALGPESASACGSGSENANPSVLKGDMSDIAQGLARGRSLVAWSDASHWQRALMRFELAIESALGREARALDVLASLDCVVEVFSASSGTPGMGDVVEIALVDEGYKPTVLFQTRAVLESVRVWDLVGHPQTLSLLVKHGLHHVCSLFSSTSEEPSFENPPSSSVPDPSFKIRKKDPWRHEKAIAFAEDVDMDDLSVSGSEQDVPGWELDLMSEDDLETLQTENQRLQQEAEMAAQYGFGPPPPTETD